MKVLLVFNAQFAGKAETTVHVPDNASDEYIKSLFEEELGSKYDENCYYEILSDKHSEKL